MQILLFLHSTHSAVTVMNNHFHKKVQGNKKIKLQKKNQKMKYMDQTLTKTERNRLHMEIYWQERCSKKQKEKIRV